jgi:hypothetical protein
MTLTGYWYNKFYNKNTPYRPSSDEQLIEKIVHSFSDSYKNNPHLYNNFSRAQDKNDVVIKYLMSNLDIGTSAIEIGGGSGRHLELAKLFKAYTLLEPSHELTSLIKKKNGIVRILNGSFPEDIQFINKSDTILAFWADVPIQLFVKETHSTNYSQSIWVMSGSNSEFAKLWPIGAREAWERRISYMIDNGFNDIRLNTSIIFNSHLEARKVISKMMGISENLVNKNVFSQEVVILIKKK